MRPLLRFQFFFAVKKRTQQNRQRIRTIWTHMPHIYWQWQDTWCMWLIYEWKTHFECKVMVTFCTGSIATFSGHIARYDARCACQPKHQNKFWKINKNLSFSSLPSHIDFIQVRVVDMPHTENRKEFNFSRPEGGCCCSFWILRLLETRMANTSMQIAFGLFLTYFWIDCKHKMEMEEGGWKTIVFFSFIFRCRMRIIIN